ncbi:MAG: hypothetical protein AB7S80_08365 [Rhizobiaceae bacterium]
MTETVTLTDHDAIRDWAAARAGFPAIVDVSAASGTQPMLRLVFGQHAYQDVDRAERPQNAGGTELVEWDEWFELFDKEELAVIVAQDRPGVRDSWHQITKR